MAPADEVEHHRPQLDSTSLARPLVCCCRGDRGAVSGSVLEAVLERVLVRASDVAFAHGRHRVDDGIGGHCVIPRLGDVSFITSVTVSCSAAGAVRVIMS